MSAPAIPAPARRDLFEDEHEAFRESYRAFLNAEVVPNYAQWTKDCLVPRELYTKAAGHGFVGVDIPEQYGGGGIEDWRFNVVMAEEAARANVADAMAGLMIHSDIVVPYIMESGDEAQFERWLPGIAAGEQLLAVAMTEPGTGSDLAGIKTRAVRDGDHYVVNGSKTFITGGINADLVVVAVRTSDDKHGGLSMLVIERGMDGFTRGPQIDKLGQHASDTCELFFDDVRVPVENLLGAEGTGFMQLVSRLVPERLILGVASIAACEVCLDLTLDYVKTRKAFGKPIGAFQNTRFTMAELKTKVDMARCFVDRSVQRYLDGTCTVEEAAMCKFVTTDLLCEVTDTGVQMHGGYGYTSEYPIGKAWVDARVGKIYAGTNEIMKELIGRTMGL